MIITMNDGTLIKLDNIIAIEPLRYDASMLNERGYQREEPVYSYTTLKTDRGDVRIILNKVDCKKHINQMREIITQDMAEDEIKSKKDEIDLYRIGQKEYDNLVKHWAEFNKPDEETIKEFTEDVVNIRCVRCGTKHDIEPEHEYYYHKSDPHHIYEFYKQCCCGKYLSGERIDHYLFRDKYEIFSYRTVEFKNCKAYKQETKWENKN